MSVILEKILEKNSVSAEEAVKLYDLPLSETGKAAQKIRLEKFGKKTYFNINRHINPSNICKDVCKFCAFSAHRKNPNPYTLSIDECVEIAKNAYKKGAKEVHVVSAHNPEVGYEYYMNIVKEIRKELPDIHIKAFTAAEVNFFSELSDKKYEEVLTDMASAGVDSMPGGGAEIFDEKIRAKICKGKVSSDDWFKIHKIWHKMGKKSNVTMLFGHIEERIHRIDHMLRIKKLQDETGGFNAFIPLVYQRKNNYLNVKKFLTGVEILKTIAISRILLQNIPNIKAYWVTTTLNLSLVAQEYGANDIDGTIEKESINSAAGAESSNGLKLNDLVNLIKDSGFIPVERDSLYNEIKIY
ncbi:aminofutalosine synthase MqnE [Nautilia sp. PV-1]|uniref:aminofutalosine synthase MqnE n=1 Tax=Nautilia sp. PV-1 TaxID=2579250 RepID=UPI000FD89BC3|nr:aminofutalosine synthase MqnE [Nautilia sp. PV-1]AZV46971.1 aminofutalosine synthase MqnE [Nautilia sp. PV-1]